MLRQAQTGIFTFLFSGAFTKERSLVANPAFQGSLGGCDCSASHQQTVSCFSFIIYHAIDLASVNFLSMIIKPRFREGFGRPQPMDQLMKRFAVYRPHGPDGGRKLFAHDPAFF
jgi:hypothetical protein